MVCSCLLVLKCQDKDVTWSDKMEQEQEATRWAEVRGIYRTVVGDGNQLPYGANLVPGLLDVRCLAG